MKKELLPCLRSFTSGLRVAEVSFEFTSSQWLLSLIFRWCGTWACWSSRTLQKPPLSSASKILGLFSRLRMDRKGGGWMLKCLYDNTLRRFEDYLRGWMKGIGDLLNESEQLRVETDDSGPQVFSKSWINISLNSDIIITANPARKTKQLRKQFQGSHRKNGKSRSRLGVAHSHWDFLNESEQPRVETDDSSPQVFSKFHKLKQFYSKLLQHHHCKSHKKQTNNKDKVFIKLW